MLPLLSAGTVAVAAPPSLDEPLRTGATSPDVRDDAKADAKVFAARSVPVAELRDAAKRRQRATVGEAASEALE